MKIPVLKKTLLLLSSLSIVFLSHPALAAQSPTTLAETTVVTSPAVSQASVLTLAQNTALAIFNYDYENYQDRLKLAAASFTPEGWNSYLSALVQSGNLATMQQHQVTMTGQITGTATIAPLANSNNVQQWLVQIPMQVVYTSSKGDKIIHHLLVKIIVTATTNSNGIGVTQVIAAPAR